MITIKKYKLVSIVLMFAFVSCKSSDLAAQKILKPIIETTQVSKFSEREETVLAATILQDVHEYGESCEKKENKTEVDKAIFLKIENKNPSKSLLNRLNQSKRRYFAAKEGVAIFKRELLIGYQHKINKGKGYLISISNITFSNDSSASVYFSQSKTSLSGVDKTYYLKKSNAQWEISGCKVHSYS